MATTFYDDNTGYFVRKIKTLTGKYRKIKIGKPAPGSDPNIIPPDILDMGERWQDEHIVIQPAKVESAATLTVESAATVFGPQPARRIDLYQHLEAYYRSQSKRLRPLSLDKLRLIINTFTGWCKGRGIRYFDEVRAVTVKGFLDDPINAHIAPVTMRNYLAMLGKCWTLAIRYEQYHGPNPIRVVCHELPASNPDARPVSLTEEEIRALLAVIAERKARPFETGRGCHLPQWVEDIVVVMLNTGIRVGAACNLSFDWIDGQRMTIPVAFSKSGKAYSTVINDKVKAIIDRRRVELGPHAERVFPDARGGAHIYSRLNYLAKSLVKQGKWKRDKGHYCHVLRHTFITEQIRAGVPLVMASKLAGHTSVAMTQRYDQTTGDDAIVWALTKGVTL